MTAPDTFIALLRGINIGSHNRIAMPDLRTLCEALGWADVRTYIQSGNVVFRAAAAAAELETLLEQAIARRLRLHVPVIVRSASEWSAYAAANPFPDAAQAEPKALMLGFSKATPRADAASTLAARATNGERVALTGDALWIHFANGVARSKLTPALLERLVGSPVTLRNWRTAVELERMAGEVKAGPAS